MGKFLYQDKEGVWAVGQYWPNKEGLDHLYTRLENLQRLGTKQAEVLLDTDEGYKIIGGINEEGLVWIDNSDIS